MPILASADEFIALRNNGNYEAFSKIFVTLFIFSREKELLKCRDIILTFLSQDQLDYLLMHLIEVKNSKFKNLNQCKPIQDLFTFRLKFLNEKLNQFQGSWIMNGCIPSHPEVEVFLKSEQQLMIYRGSGMPSGAFSSKAPADRFVVNYSGVKNGYSVEMTVAKNPREKHHIVIRKTMQSILTAKAAYQAKYIKNIDILSAF